MYTLSNNIKVFPSANRGNGIDAHSRLNTEFNLTNLINRLVDRKSFVITTNDEFRGNLINPSNPAVPIEFNIDGYYFNILDIRDALSNALAGYTRVYAHIKIGEYTENNGYQELQPFETVNSLDNNTQFYGVALTGSSTMSGATDTLLLLQRSSTSTNDWCIPQNSRVKFVIDDGVLE